MDQILMQGMSFYGYTGVLDFEKRDGQIFLVDVELELPPIAACETDRLEDTVSYAAAFDIVKNVFEHERYDLVERLCGVISKRLIESFESVDRVTVTVRKPHAPIDGQFESMGVRITRHRSDFEGKIRP